MVLCFCFIKFADIYVVTGKQIAHVSRTASIKSMMDTENVARGGKLEVCKM